MNKKFLDISLMREAIVSKIVANIIFFALSTLRGNLNLTRGTQFLRANLTL